MAKELAIVLNNGGLNAAVISALAHQKHRPIMVHVESAGPAAAGARRAYDQQVALFKPYREHRLEMQFLNGLSAVDRGNALTADPRQPMPITPRLVELLPLLGIAARFAVHYNAAAIYLGLRIGDAADDLARGTEFGQIWNELLQLPCGQVDTEFLLPLIDLEPWQVVDLGCQVDAPFERSWSCLDAPDTPCGACRGCRTRDAAFVQAARPDPLAAGRRA
jgi:7-cyano-7-deazaguanine synthase in queuosine biosynthesis